MSRTEKEKKYVKTHNNLKHNISMGEINHFDIEIHQYIKHIPQINWFNNTNYKRPWYFVCFDGIFGILVVVHSFLTYYWSPHLFWNLFVHTFNKKNVRNAVFWGQCITDIHSRIYANNLLGEKKFRRQESESRLLHQNTTWKKAYRKDNQTNQ